MVSKKAKSRTLLPEIIFLSKKYKIHINSSIGQARFPAAASAISDLTG